MDTVTGNVWRGEYSDSVTYYRDNIVTANSSIFKALNDNFMGVPPVEVNADGKVRVVNANVWECVFNNVRLYNAVGADTLQYCFDLKEKLNEKLLGMWDNEFLDAFSNSNYSLEFLSSNGTQFRVGGVNTTITPYLYYGNNDVTANTVNTDWYWTRESESGSDAADLSWNGRHRNMRILQLTNADMPTAWSRTNKAIFTCTVTINDGKNQIIVQNQVIA